MRLDFDFDDVVLNTAADRSAAYTPAQQSILSDDGLERARSVISAWPGYAPTPLIGLPALADTLGIASLAYKDEGARFGLGSFKALGGAYAVAELLSAAVSQQTGRTPAMADILAGRYRDIAAALTVCCATDGNHGRSVAWGAERLGCRAVIFLHATVSAGRQAAIERYGARIIRTAGHYDDCVREAARQADAHGWHVVSDTSYEGYTDIPRFVMQGYEVMASEAYDALGEPPTHIIIQTGVGGVAAAVAAAAKRRWGSNRPTVILADPARAACWVTSFRTGTPTPASGDLDTVMAGLACGEVSILAWRILVDHADAVVAVPDDAALDAMRRLAVPQAGDPPIVAGESATAGLAALIALCASPDRAALVGLDQASRVLLFGTEGDTDPALYEAIVGRPAREILAGAAA